MISNTSGRTSGTSRARSRGPGHVSEAVGLRSGTVRRQPQCCFAAKKLQYFKSMCLSQKYSCSIQLQLFNNFLMCNVAEASQYCEISKDTVSLFFSCWYLCTTARSEIGLAPSIRVLSLFLSSPWLAGRGDACQRPVKRAAACAVPCRMQCAVPCRMQCAVPCRPLSSCCRAAEAARSLRRVSKSR